MLSESSSVEGKSNKSFRTGQDAGEEALEAAAAAVSRRESDKC